MSKKAKLVDRIKRVGAILIPLLMTTMDRIDIISNGMDLRGFGKHNKRTWYSRKPLVFRDYCAMFVCLLLLCLSLYLRFKVNHSIYYNPFI